jgi:hypothetical protein
LWIKTSTLSDATRNNRWNSRGECQQEKKLHHFKATLCRKLFGTDKKMHTVSDVITHKEISHGGNRKIH